MFIDVCDQAPLRLLTKNWWHSVETPGEDVAGIILVTPLPIRATNTWIIYNNNQNTCQLPDLPGRKSLPPCWRSFRCIVKSKSAAINHCVHHYLNSLGAFLPDSGSALLQSQGQSSSCMGRSHSNNIDTSCWVMHFTRYTSVYQPIFTCNCSLFSHNGSLCHILDQATYRTWWEHIDLFWLTFSCVPYSSLFRLHWWWATPV